MNRLHLAFRWLMCAGLAALLGFTEAQGVEPGKADLPQYQGSHLRIQAHLAK